MLAGARARDTLCVNVSGLRAHAGVWLRVLNIMSLLAVFTNCGLIAFTSKTLAVTFPTLSPAEKMIAVFVFEVCVCVRAY